MIVAPGMVPLSISRLKASDMRCSARSESPIDSGLTKGRGGVCRTGPGLAVVGAVIFSPYALFTLFWIAGPLGPRQVWAEKTSLAEKICVEQGVNRFTLAINRVRMLETAQIGGNADPS
jgi:hypothetical protein